MTTFRFDDQQTLVEMILPCGESLIRSTAPDGRVLEEREPGGLTLTWHYTDDDVHDARLDHLGNVYPPESEQPNIPEPFEITWPPVPLVQQWGWGTADLFEHPPEIPCDISNDLAAEARQLISAPAQAPISKYDGLGNLVEEEDRSGRRRRWRYDRAGNLIEFRDAALWNEALVTLDAQHRRDARGELAKNDSGYLSSIGVGMMRLGRERGMEPTIDSPYIPRHLIDEVLRRASEE